MVYKGIVVDVTNRHAVVLNDLGFYQRIRLKGSLKPGDRVLYTEEDVLKKGRTQETLKWLAWAAVLVLVFSFTNLREAAFESRVCAVVSLDINPSVQFYIGSEEQVIGAEALNDDGAGLMDLRDLKGLGIEKALHITLSEAREASYLKGDGKILVAVAGLKTGFEEMDERLAQTIFNDPLIRSDEIEVMVLEADLSDFRRSRNQEASLGKYKVYELNAAKGNVSLEDIRSMKVADLVEKDLMEEARDFIVSNKPRAMENMEGQDPLLDLPEPDRPDEPESHDRGKSGKEPVDDKGVAREGFRKTDPEQGSEEGSKTSADAGEKAKGTPVMKRNGRAEDLNGTASTIDVHGRQVAAGRPVEPEKVPGKEVSEESLKEKKEGDSGKSPTKAGGKKEAGSDMEKSGKKPRNVAGGADSEKTEGERSVEKRADHREKTDKMEKDKVLSKAAAIGKHAGKKQKN